MRPRPPALLLGDGEHAFCQAEAALVEGGGDELAARGRAEIGWSGRRRWRSARPAPTLLPTPLPPPSPPLPFSCTGALWLSSRALHWQPNGGGGGLARLALGGVAAADVSRGGCGAAAGGGGDGGSLHGEAATLSLTVGEWVWVAPLRAHERHKARATGRAGGGQRPEG